LTEAVFGVITVTMNGMLGKCTSVLPSVIKRKREREREREREVN